MEADACIVCDYVQDDVRISVGHVNQSFRKSTTHVRCGPIWNGMHHGIESDTEFGFVVLHSRGVDQVATEHPTPALGSFREGESGFIDAAAAIA
ncbi:hypothetical protein BLJ79_09340 [Arthrobacter sp. UCD-GKA]|nr:hypothetical protein BLJ79_09340 [Arthrobacter sp. UCD-GKA]